MTYVLLALERPVFRMLSLLLSFLILYFPGKHLFGVFLVRMPALCTIRTAGELTALKSVFIALPIEQRL